MLKWPAYVPEKWRVSREQILERLQSDAPEEAPAAVDRQSRSKVRSQYVEMRDGTRLAVDVWLPASYSGEALPTVVMFTRYWRAETRGDTGRHYGGNSAMAESWNAAGYLYVVVDLRGTGASFGRRSSEYSEDEFRDYADTLDWVAEQSWCDGFIATEGGSYSGNVAELATAAAPQRVRAAIPRFTDFDSYQSIACPGGIPNLAVLLIWGLVTQALDQCVGHLLTNENDAAAQQRQPMPVDDDSDRQLLAEAMKQHRANFNALDVALATEYSDDSVSGVPSRHATSLYMHQKELQDAGVPQFAWASWMDAATADGLICRFQNFRDLPMVCLIGSWAHLGLNPGDPFGCQAGYSPGELVDTCAEFLDLVRGGGMAGSRREIRYYTMGADEWNTTSDWPPPGVREETWFLRMGQTLSHTPLLGQSSFDSYTTRATSTGTSNRWHTQLGGGAVNYPGRIEAGAQLLCYDSGPLPKPLEVTGHPILDLHIQFEKPDAAVFTYLEAVLPDGSVLCLTEGMLRARHWPEAEVVPPYTVPGPQRLFRRRDLATLDPATPTRLRFRMLPTSFVLPAQSRLRLSIAGQDADTFASFPDETPQRIRVYTSTTHPSQLLLPMRWREQDEM